MYKCAKNVPKKTRKNEHFWKKCTKNVQILKKAQKCKNAKKNLKTRENGTKLKEIK